MFNNIKDISLFSGSATMEYSYAYDYPMSDTHRLANGRCYVVNQWGKDNILSKTKYFKFKFNAQAFLFELQEGGVR